MGTAAVVMAWVPLVLGLDRQAGAGGQWLLGALSWLLLLALLRRADGLTRAQVAVVVVYATAVEYGFSAELGVYTYLHHALFPYIPPFVPPGHGLVYLAALRFGRDPRVRRQARWLVPVSITAVGVWALWGVLLASRTDVLGLLWFGCLVLFARRSREPAVYAGVAVVVTWLELVGTHWGIWAWALRDPTGLIGVGNPPSGAAGGYGFFDAAALALGPWVLSQAQALRTMVARSVTSARQPSSRPIRAGSATSTAGSPARRGASARASCAPVTRSTASSTSRTEKPVPTPTL